ncbi:MarR family winged helix-turn-helix transcriptional regulator [Paraburkholderia fungorum]|uniref:MarR family winged helix-turn-helix transcriptional regulator n=1 Tax=Paraburkholderia fungorum TaxID=134537 RepID=UPI0009450CEA|nr:MarR family transcriptional regulator [Paraburkholderia fungorum]
MKSDRSPEHDSRDLALALQLLVRRIRAAAPACSNELTWTQNAVLMRLAQTDRMTSAELARAEGMKPQSMAVAIAPLEQMGLVRRVEDAADARRLNVQLTDKGRLSREDTAKAKQTWLAHAVAKLDPAQRAVLLDALPVIQRLGEMQ